MEEMKRRFLSEVGGRLAAAPDSTAKSELVEELSDNLYRRYQEMTASGMGEKEAFDRAMDELGDTGELVDYLKGLAPDEELPELTLHPYDKQDGEGWPGKDELNGLVDEVGDVVRSALDKAGSALRQAKQALDEAGRTGSWRSRDGSVTIHFGGHDDPKDLDGEMEDLDEQLEHLSDEPGEQGGAQRSGASGDAGGFSYSNNSSATLMFNGDACTVDDSAQPLRGVDVQTVNGDVTIRLLECENGPIRVEGDVDQLEVKVTENGVLAIRQGRTASSSFFFLRGLSSADVELYLPRRHWQFVQVSAVNGDVDLERGLELDRLSVKTTSGDLDAEVRGCKRLYFKSASGSLRCLGLEGSASVETMSGDVRLEGRLDQARLKSMSGDVELEGSVRSARLSSMSGDVRLESALPPEAMELSSKSGDCEARIPDSESFTLRFKTTSGQFHSDFPLQRTSQGVIYGSGGSRTYSMSSISGDLELKRY